MSTPFTPLPDESTATTQAAAQTQPPTTTPPPTAASQTPPPAATPLPTITPEDKLKFNIPDDLIKSQGILIDLILKSESMKDDERTYWFSLLPVMSAEQITKLQTILQNERDQLAAIDQKYATQMAAVQENGQFEERILKAKQERAAREAAERSHRTAEETAADDLLSRMNSL